MPLNFTDDLGFDETAASPNDVILISTPSGNVSFGGNVKFTSEGVYAETPSGSAFGQAIVFWPWTNINYIQQNR
jgi:hypothetical protein